MEQMTVRINDEECIIMPAPKGAFVKTYHFWLPYFVPYVAVSVDALSNRSKTYADASLNIYPLSHSYYDDFVEWDKDRDFFTSLSGNTLEHIYDECINQEEDNEPKYYIIMLYQMFKSHGTPMEDRAINWFKDKFKEHNITKSDFDVFG